MKFYKTMNLYKASNVTFNPQKIMAFSYSWWCFVRVVEGKLIFNDYRYSPSTGKHQSKVLDLMENLGIKPDYCLQIPGGLKDDLTLQDLFNIHEDTLISQFLDQESKKIKWNERARERRIKVNALKVLENVSQDIQALKRTELSVVGD